MILSTDKTAYYIYSDDFEGDIEGEIIKQGTLNDLKVSVLDLVKTSSIPVLKMPVVEVTELLKPANVVLLIEIEANKAYKIYPCFGQRLMTIQKTFAGGLLDIIEKVETLL